MSSTDKTKLDGLDTMTALTTAELDTILVQEVQNG